MTVADAVAGAHRREWAFVLAATVRVTRDLDLAEECVQDAYAKALTAWTGKQPAWLKALGTLALFLCVLVAIWLYMAVLGVPGSRIAAGRYAPNSPPERGLRPDGPTRS